MNKPRTYRSNNTFVKTQMKVKRNALFFCLKQGCVTQSTYLTPFVFQKHNIEKPVLYSFVSADHNKFSFYIYIQDVP